MSDETVEAVARVIAGPAQCCCDDDWRQPRSRVCPVHGEGSWPYQHHYAKARAALASLIPVAEKAGDRHMSGHLDGPPPGPPDPPYIPGDLGAPSAEEFARRRASPEPERNPYLAVSPHEIIQERADRLARCWDEGFAAGRAAATPDGWTPTSDAPDAPGWECELCGGKLDGPGEKCGSAQHGPAGTVVYGRAVPSGGPIPDSEFGVTSTVLDPKTGIAEPVTTGRIPDAEFVEPPLMPPAASPDSPDDREGLIAAEFFAAGLRAASPDERLREALREVVRQVEEYPALSPTGIMVRDDIAGMVEGTARAALAATDRDKPEANDG